MKYLMTALFSFLVYAGHAQLAKNKIFQYDWVGGLCAETCIFYDSIGFYHVGCEANFSHFGAFRYVVRNDSIILSPVRFEDYGLLRKVISEKKDSVSGIKVEAYDLFNHKMFHSSIGVYKRGRKKDKLIGSYISISAQQVKSFRKKNYYWTLQNVYPLFNNELTLEFSFSERYNLYKIYLDAPEFCLYPAKIKSWVWMEGAMKIYSATSIGYFDDPENPLTIFEY
jgi:hypothetical protein